jgi:hypothetical protein
MNPGYFSDDDLGLHLKFDIVMSFLSLLTLALLVFTLSLLAKVHRLFKFQDLVLLLSVISLSLSLLCNLKLLLTPLYRSLDLLYTQCCFEFLPRQSFLERYEFPEGDGFCEDRVFIQRSYI